jgi:hypothetical protein
MTIPVSRPRVYLIDFEVAVSFPAESRLAECVCTGYPVGGDSNTIPETSAEQVSYTVGIVDRIEVFLRIRVETLPHQTS